MSSFIDWQERLQQNMQRFWQELTSDSPIESDRLLSSISYGSNGGKSLRALLVYATNQLAGGNIENADNCALAVELFHSFTLIHDDLPAIDNDDMRRGKASCHKVYGEATAIIAGDTLHTLAFRLLLNSPLPDAYKLDACRNFTEVALAVMSGQMLDINHEKTLYQTEKYETMCLAKTAALIRSSIALGALSAANDFYANHLAELELIGNNIGLAFQLQDDLLDIESTSTQLGKTAGSDANNNKNTLATRNPQYTKERVKDLFAQIDKSLQTHNWQQSHLATLIHTIAKRTF